MQVSETVTYEPGRRGRGMDRGGEGGRGMDRGGLYSDELRLPVGVALVSLFFPSGSLFAEV
jgi:hypothetical protein